MDIKTCKNISMRIDAPYCDIQNMKIGNEIFIRRGSTPFQTKAYDIESDAIYKSKIKIKNKKMVNKRKEEVNDLSYH